MNPVILEALHEELIKIAYMTAAGPLYMGNMPQSMGTGMVSARQAQQMTQMPGVRSMRRGGIVPEGKTQAAVLHGPEAVIPLSKDKRSTQRRKQLLKKIKERMYSGKRKMGSAEPLEKVSEVEYRGTTFPGYGKPIPSNRKGKKKMVLVKRGDKVRVVHFGQKGYQDFTQHKDKKRRKNYLTRSAGIRNKSGQLTKDDPFSPNYWARRELW